MYTRRILLSALITAGALALSFLIFRPIPNATAAPVPGLRVLNIAATPATIAPIDVLTVSTTLANDAARVDGLTVEMVVRDRTGQTVLQEKQQGIGISEKDKQSVYWVWRIPGRLTEGAYNVEMRVLGPGQKLLARQTKDSAFWVDRSQR
ncbi:MAG: hypothetical protein M1343_00010 [Chloroflexi bacterium]|nr:hypothetical protein [Chloroflexota bacterium]